jgi:hypothetical protein
MDWHNITILALILTANTILDISSLWDFFENSKMGWGRIGADEDDAKQSIYNHVPIYSAPTRRSK